MKLLFLANTSQYRFSILGMSLSFLILLFIPRTLMAKAFHERPGKTVLYPYHELNRYNYHDPAFVIHYNEQTLNLISLNSTIRIPLSRITQLTLVKEVPRLRGRLLNVFNKDDLSFMTKLYLRITSLNKDGGEDNHFITLDFKIKSDDEMKALRQDISLVNDLHLKASIVVRDYASIFDLAENHSREFYQFPFLSSYRKNLKIYDNFFSELEKTLQKASGHAYHTKKNHFANALFTALEHAFNKDPSFSSQLIGRGRLFRNQRERIRYNRLKRQKNKQNVWRVIENLRAHHMPIEMKDFKRRRLQDEFCSQISYAYHKYCAGSFLGQLLIRNNKPDLEQRYLYIDRALDVIDASLIEMAEFLKERTFDYIHKDEQDILDSYIIRIAALDEYILQTIDLTRNDDFAHLSAISSNLNRVRVVMWSKFNRVIINNNDYDISRFYEEGHFYKVYKRHIFSDTLSFINLHREKLKPFNWDIVEMSDLADNANVKDILTKGEIKDSIKELLASKLAHKGTDIGEGVVNILGKVFKKRDWVPSLRLSTNFRDNFLTARRPYVYSQLLGKDGMEPGDIILERDLQANTSFLIPGYFIHASLYVGTIKDLKRMGLWDNPKTAIIRYEIEQYKHSADRRHYLNDIWHNKFEWEDIPWFYESDRPGVGVHPLHKFLETDGMAVLRPSKGYDLAEKKEVYYRANERMYFPYDYVHNVRNKFSVSCSKVILKIFNNITFPVTTYLNYVSVSPSQIGQPVSLSPYRPNEGELKLIMFFDAARGGDLKYHHKLPKTYNFYSKYLKYIGKH